MSFYYYHYLILLPSESSFSMKGLEEKIQKRLEEIGQSFTLVSSKDQLTINIDKWSFYIHFNTEPYIQSESSEIAKRCTDEGAEKIMCIKQRLETWGDPDLNMEYFNTVLFILEIMERDYDAFIFDPIDGEFI